MPTFTPQTLLQIGCEIFEASGCSAEEAAIVSHHLVESNLYGHDSHGFIRCSDYAKGIREGRFSAHAKPEIIRQSPSTASVRAHGGLGPVGATFAARLAIEKAKSVGLAAVTLRDTGHIGRAGAYPLMAAREGLVGQIFVNVGKAGFRVAPFGGTKGRLSTNPIAFAAPRRKGDPIMVDFATSVLAEGKLRLAVNQGKMVPEGCILDNRGQPTIDPNEYYDNPLGTILPLGGLAGHKGYGLNIMLEILGGAMSGEGCAGELPAMKSNGALILVYDIENFIELETYFEEVETLLERLKNCPRLPGVEEILIPGEPEFSTARKREREGIELDARTWEKVCNEAAILGLNKEIWLSPESG